MNMNTLATTYRERWTGNTGSGRTNKGKKGDGSELHFLYFELGKRLVVVELTEIVSSTFSSLLAEVEDLKTSDISGANDIIQN
jgi:hypothetical protein